jgi:hypothetical protein
MSRPLGRAAGLLAAALGPGLLGGCSDPYRLVKVTGKVTTCQGKPAVGGVVEFQPVDAPGATGRPPGQPGRGSRGTVGPDGTFTLTTIPHKGESGEGVLTGPHRVVFEFPPTTRPVLNAQDRAVLTDFGGPEAVRAEEERLAKMVIHPRPPCSDKITPGEVEVGPGGGTFEFTLPAK